MKSFTVDVTQDHIDDGTPMCIFSCPVALALIGTGATRVMVDGTFATFTKDGTELCLVMPKNTQLWVHSFDRGENVKPFSFQF